VGAVLVKKGYNVKFFTSTRFVAFAESFGMTGVGLVTDVESMMLNHQELLDAMKSGRTMDLFKAMQKASEEEVPRSSKIFQAEIDKGLPDLCLTMLLSEYYGWWLALEHKVPFLNMCTLAFLYNPKHVLFGMPHLPLGIGQCLFYNLLAANAVYSGKLFEKCTGKNYIHQYPKKQIIQDMKQPNRPVLVLHAPEIKDAFYPDAPDMFKCLGTTVIEKDEQCTHLDNFGGNSVLKTLETFLNDGEKPIYVGWGSMISKSEGYMVEFCARACYRAKRRAVVLGGFAHLSMSVLEKQDVEPEILEWARVNLLFVAEAPHEWLFPKVAATVHHGGAGTTSVALRAGVPTIITPVFVDQFDFSFLVRQLGVGVGFKKQLQKISPGELGDAITEVLSNNEMADRAAELASKLQKEKGAESAADHIESFWEEYCVTGRFRQLFPKDTTQISSGCCSS
jgi:UDP:flavonoid glycosyltransferase YjiC (YdhE family)